MKHLIAIAVVAAALAGGSDARAQTLGLTAGAGAGRLWDDETLLGGGLLVAGGATAGVGEHVLLSGSLDWLRHERTLTYLEADGDAVSGFARATYVFGARSTRFRPIIGAGLGFIHSTGTLTTPAVIVGPGGQPIVSTVPSVKADWSLTRAAWDLHTGLRIGAGQRVVLQPEVRWRSSLGSPDYSPNGGIEPPLLGVQGLVSLGWTFN